MSNTTSASTIVAYFSTESAAEKAVQQLLEANFTSSEIGIASRSNNQTNAKTSSASTASGESTWDKVKGFFSGAPVEAYADEKTKGDFASREITSSESDYSHEDVSHSLNGFSLPEEKSRYFGHRFGAGDQGSVVTVTAPGREEDAETILTENGGDLGADASNYDYANYAESDSTPVSDQQRIQLLGEVLRVHKDRISAGEVRIRKDVITETQTIEVPVTREELVIERFAGSGTAPVDGRVGEGSEIRIPLTEEVASAEKHTFVREEVAIGKRAVEDVRSVGDTVSHEELVVEDSTKRSA